MPLNELLDIIYELESSSGRNKKAYTPNEYGALGGYQIRPDAYSDVQRVYRSKWRNVPFQVMALDDNLSRQAADDYLKIIGMHFRNVGVKATPENLLAGYHAGMGNAAKGKLGLETKKYLTKARVLMGD